MTTADPLQCLDKSRWAQNAPTCHNCYAKFGLFKHRHHCRVCGQCFCSACTRKAVVTRPEGGSGLENTCNPCYEERLLECPNNCRTKVKANHQSMHLNAECNKRSVACGECDAKLVYEELFAHETKQCPHRMVTCPEGCGSELKLSAVSHHVDASCACRDPCLLECGAFFAPSRMTDHLNDVCPNRLVGCTLACRAEVQAKSLDAHVRNDCPERNVACTQGCGRSLKARLLQGHLASECTNRAVPCVEGCGMGGLRASSLPDHLRNSCSRRARCPLQCGALVAPSLLNAHKQNECDNRPTTCPDCRTALAFCQLDGHKRVACVERVVACPTQCRTTGIKARSLAQHQSQSCPNRAVSCPEGCGRQIRACDVERHTTTECSTRMPCRTCGVEIAPSQVRNHGENECLRVCKSRHPLRPILHAGGFCCDVCKITQAAGNPGAGIAMSCAPCNFDVCPKCAPRQDISCPWNCYSKFPLHTTADHEKKCPKYPIECCYCDDRPARERSAAHRLNCPKRPTKIQAACATMVMFLRNLMSEADRCSVVAFNDGYLPLINLGPEAHAIAALIAIMDKCEGGTKLWNAVCMSVIQFIKTASPSRPWILIILTDGADTGSELDTTQTASLLAKFNEPPSNFTFFIGLGKDVEEHKLRSMCQNSGSMYLGAEDSSALQTFFALIALQVVSGIRVDIATVETEGVQAAFARVSRERALRRQPIDILMLCDISGSMRSK